MPGLPRRSIRVASSRATRRPEIEGVVPEPLIGKFPASIRADIQTHESFMGDLRLLAPGAT